MSNFFSSFLLKFVVFSLATVTTVCSFSLSPPRTTTRNGYDNVSSIKKVTVVIDGDPTSTTLTTDATRTHKPEGTEEGHDGDDSDNNDINNNKTTTDESNLGSRRVFVGGIQIGDNDDIQSRLRQALEERYGPIENIFVLRDTSAHPYAFVDFVEAACAQQAIQDYFLEKTTTTATTKHDDKKKNDDRQQQHLPPYREIKPAKTIAPHKRKKSAQRKTKAQRDYDTKLQIARSSTMLIQVQKSHLDRVIDLLEEESSLFRVIGSYSCSKTLAMVGVVTTAQQPQQGNNLAEQQQQLHHYLKGLETNGIPIFQCAIRKLYTVDPNKMVLQQERQDDDDDDDDDGLAKCVFEMEQLVQQQEETTTNNHHHRVRLNVFPPSVLQELITYLQEEQQRFDLLTRLSPKDYTHTLSVVKIPTTTTTTTTQHRGGVGGGAGKKDTNNLWCIGMIEEAAAAVAATALNPSATLVGDLVASSVTSDDNNDDDDDDNNNMMICRAQSKLREAFARYKYPLPSNNPDRHESSPRSSSNGVIAVDCGAAPGGWTKFLATTTTADNNNNVKCNKIYSIDPGELDSTILINHKDVVIHLQMKVEDAMNEILKRESQSAVSAVSLISPHQNNNKNNASSSRNPLVDIWVSDMCLHQMSEQVDLMLDAQTKGIVGSGTFFVLTLKCNKGHSRNAFDEQVAEQYDRLQDICHNLQTIHLFSNRNGERTIMGYLK